MRFPKSLKANGRIGVIAPSFGATIEPYCTRSKEAIKKFSGMGYEIVPGPNFYKCDGIGKSTSAKACAEEINDFFLNDKSDIIISAGGGETMCEDLEFVDFKGIKKATPKWFTGYSDNTNLTFTLATLCDTASIYGPCFASYGMKEWHPAIEDAFAIMRGKGAKPQAGAVAHGGGEKQQTGGAKQRGYEFKFHNYNGFELEEIEKDPLDSYNIDHPYSQKIFVGDKAASKIKFSGRLLGGCLDCLINLCGTKYDAVARKNKEFGVKPFVKRYKEDKVLWFIEACELDPISTRRALWQLDNAGWFKNAAGFIFGRPMKYGAESFGITHYDAYLSVLGKYGLPIVMDIDLGHLPPMIPIICGAKAKVEAHEQAFDINMKCK